MKPYLLHLLLFFAVLIWSAIKPHDYFTWALEVAPALIGMIVLISTYQNFRFTNLTYTFILIHCILLFVGGHYTYAEVPLFNWVKETFHQSRNNYDKVGHFAQGFIPAMIVRELFIRKKIVPSKGGWLPFLTVCVCLSISACYEFIEWWVAEWTGDSAESFLGTQGYAWDTQSDMLYASIGAIAMLLLLSKKQDQQLETLKL